jgi:flagellar protein FliS
MLKGYGQYTQAYQKAQVNTVDQRKLIVMLYDGAIRFLTLAVDKLNAGDQYEAHNNLIRGKSIIAELLASLNMEQGGDIAKNLQRLYSYMFNELIDANLNKDPKRITHVLHLLRELRVGWQGAKGSMDAPKAPAAQSPPVGSPAKRITVKG